MSLSVFDKIFYINLSKDSDRNSNFIKEMNKFNITNFERVEGVLVNEVPDESLFRNFNESDRKYILGSLGARESHLKVIRTAKERGYQKVLILEDDVYFSSNPNNVNLDFYWDMVYLGGKPEPQFRNQVVGAYAYGLSSKIYDDILNMAIPSGMEIDNFYAKILQHMSLNSGLHGKYSIHSISNYVAQVDFSYNSNIR